MSYLEHVLKYQCTRFKGLKITHYFTLGVPQLFDVKKDKINNHFHLELMKIQRFCKILIPMFSAQGSMLTWMIFPRLLISILQSPN